MKDQRPNIVLITTDEMRGDCMGIAGHPDVKTPYLDTFASQGMYYPNAYSACPSCIPARAALHTGLAPKNNGRVGYRDRVNWNYEHTLAGELSKIGYYTQCVGKMHVHPLRNYLGFNNVELHDGYLHAYRHGKVEYYENQLIADDYFYWLKEEKGISADVTDTGLECNSWMARPWIYEEKYHPTNWVTSRAIDFLRRRDTDKPFFMHISYVRPHAPYDAPQCYFDMYKDMELRAPAEGDWDEKEWLIQNGRICNSLTGSSDKELIRQQMIGYYACITHVDHQIGRFFQAMYDHNIMGNTIIIFTSDHGEMLSDHGLIRKSRAYQGSIHIPMIIWGAGKRGICHEITELRDIMPTVLKMANCPDIDKIPTDGIDLLDKKSLAEREYIHGEHEMGERSSHFIVTKYDKYIWYSQSGIERYFRLDKDPFESRNEVHNPKYLERVCELKNILVRELYGREEGYSDGEHLFTGKTPVQCLSFILNKDK